VTSFSISENKAFFAGLWIRIGYGFNDFVDPDPDSKSGSAFMGKKNEEKNMHFSLTF
jgi:hypothetical protein